MNSRSWVSIEAFSIVSAARNRCSKLLPVRRFLSFACTIARRFPGVWCRNSTTRHGSPLNTRTIPRRIWVAGIAISVFQELRSLTEIDAVLLRPGVDEWERKRKQPRNLAAFFTSVKLRHDGFESAPHVVGDDPLAGNVRMQSVGLVETRDSGDAVQQEWE